MALVSSIIAVIIRGLNFPEAYLVRCSLKKKTWERKIFKITK